MSESIHSSADWLPRVTASSRLWLIASAIFLVIVAVLVIFSVQKSPMFVVTFFVICTRTNGEISKCGVTTNCEPTQQIHVLFSIVTAATVLLGSKAWYDNSVEDRWIRFDYVCFVLPLYRVGGEHLLDSPFFKYSRMIRRSSTQNKHQLWKPYYTKDYDISSIHCTDIRAILT